MEENRSPESISPQGQRIRDLLAVLGLELSGFAQLTGISDSHLYAISNGNKILTARTAEKICTAVQPKPAVLTSYKRPIPKSARQSPNVVQFYKTYSKSNPEYFQATHSLRKYPNVVYEKVVQKGLIVEETSVYQIRKLLDEADIALSSKEVSRTMEVLKENGLVQSTEREMELKDGNKGKRMVKYYFGKPKSKDGR